jgi:alcohol dehydrogenase class IV
VVGIGGGSALDLGKAVAALLTNGGDPLDYLEVIGQGKKIEREPAPYIAIPTTSGTGSEVTRNAVLESPEHRVKVSLRSQLMLPKLALVDPRLCVSVPPEVTASTGFDALAQVIEPYVSNRRNPMTDALCLEAIGRGARSLLRAYRNGEDLDAREDMAIASLFGGLALANAKLGAVHGFAGPLGGMYGAPHGALCAALLPGVMAVNVAALQKRDPDSEVLERYATVARLLTDNANAQPEDAAVWARETAEELRIPKLSEYGVKQDALREITNKAAGASSMQGNPIVLTEEELEKVVRSAL